MTDRFKAFGAVCVSCDGHDIQAVIDAASKTPHKDKPLVVIARTNGTTGIPPLQKRWPFLHFVRIKEDERNEFIKIYEEL